ncbi:ARMT1-like domain-containing protein [Pseudonocardia humida]|uniref:Protein-glutamate O-methyltransferase family protein n=1 Tax=Pseudonocardia humida TaxID=2800819 RepID=A0ABT0ZYE5_9PSEU|nr:ARMT1-like domain-containing protein [Pseudonocardia humida]MCO1655756.1 protein-glutamate O-methyltransferase family protein [Pseudonocardia humida]
MRHLVPGAAARAARESAPEPPVLTAADPASFGWTVVHRRLPRAAEQARNANPYLPEQTGALDRLVAELSGAVGPLTDDGPDTATWREWGKGHVGKAWDEVPLLWAETFFHRRLLAAVDFFVPGPWHWLDPFAHLKTAQLVDPLLQAELAELDWVTDVDPDRRARALLMAAVRGARADLGVAAHSARFGPDGAADEPDPTLVVDDSAALWELLAAGPAVVCLVVDNAGRELLADLLLVDELLESGRAGEVLLHVRPVPFHVVDATASDVAAALRRLGDAGGYAATAARRLREAFRGGRIRLRTSWFHVGPLGFDAMAGELAADVSGAGLTILKGDLNYRRLVGDRAWPPGTGLAHATAHLPGPVVALRTLESEVVVGVPEARTAELDRRAPDWRIAGTHALVQLVPGRAASAGPAG